MENPKQIKDEILKKISRFYDNFDQALEWYRTPNIYFREKLSPEQMVNNGKGQEVLEWVNKALDLK